MVDIVSPQAMLHAPAVVKHVVLNELQHCRYNS
jgi:hypothetical protein